MAEFNLKIKCTNCGGSGEVSVGEGATPGNCPICGGDGVLGEGTVDGAEQIADLADKVNDILDKCNDIFEKLNE